MQLHDWTIDIGNSRIKWAAFQGDALCQTGVWESWDEVVLLTALTNLPPRSVILSTVTTELPTAVERVLLHEGAHLLYLDETTRLPFDNTYRTPHTLGKDRLAAVAGAQYFYPGQHCLVVDAGTCITTDWLETGRVYRGGNISPGVRMRLRAMHQFTARLPLVATVGETATFLLGDSTELALRNGAVLGSVLELEALVMRLARDYGNLTVVLTGGDAALLAARWSESEWVEQTATETRQTALRLNVSEAGQNAATCSIFVQPNLVLFGLKQILQYNV